MNVTMISSGSESFQKLTFMTSLDLNQIGDTM